MRQGGKTGKEKAISPSFMAALLSLAGLVLERKLLPLYSLFSFYSRSIS